MYTALGLESEFQLEQQFTGFPGEGGFLQVLNPLQKILYQRFRFNFSIREVSRSITRLDNEKERIIRSIDNGIPMILILADGRDNITNKHAENHAVLIDGYVNNGEGFWVKINWGLGNRGLLNDNLYPTDGQINVTYHDDKYNYDVNRTWGRFVLYFNVVPR
jgi:hypothetical protein